MSSSFERDEKMIMYDLEGDNPDRFKCTIPAFI
jgi:hypothetical protein